MTTLPSKKVSKKLVLAESPYRPLLRTLLRSTSHVRTHARTRAGTVSRAQARARTLEEINGLGSQPRWNWWVEEETPFSFNSSKVKNREFLGHRPGDPLFVRQGVLECLCLFFPEKRLDYLLLSKVDSPSLRQEAPDV